MAHVISEAKALAPPVATVRGAVVVVGEGHSD
jgi:hypothetical protein